MGTSLPGGFTLCPAVDEPERADAVHHREDVVVGERVPEQQVGLKVELRQDDGDAQQPREHAQGPCYAFQLLELDRFTGHLVVFILKRKSWLALDVTCSEVHAIDYCDLLYEYSLSHKSVCFLCIACGN